MTRFSVLLSVAAISLAANAQTSKSLADEHIDSLLTSNKVIFLDGKPAEDEARLYVDSLRRRISEFYYDQFRHFQDPGAPYFLL